MNFLQASFGIVATIPPSRVRAVELGSWDDFNIRFSIIGMDGCGTTSARGNLGLHPELGFSASQNSKLYEDTFFTWTISYYLIPPKPLLKQWLDFNQAKRRSASLLGLYNAIIWRHPMARLALYQMKLRPLLVVCSPARWLSSSIINYENRTPQSVTVKDLIENDRWTDLAVRHLKEWRRLFGERLLVIHQEALLQRETYDTVCAFLGVSPMPSSAKLGRFKVHGTNWRSGLCRSTDQVLLEKLNQRLRPQVSATEQLLRESYQTVPPSLWQAQGHCTGKPARACRVASRDVPCE